MKRQYYIAILPPEPILSEIKELKEHARDEFKSGHALRSPAHITLIPPFHFAGQRQGELEALLIDQVGECADFNIELNGFGNFPPRVIFIDVVLSNGLMSFQSQLEVAFVQRFDVKYRAKEKFTPHITVAYRYPEDTIFEAAWKHFGLQRFHRTFNAARVSLLRHQGNGWDVVFETNFPTL